MTQLVITYFAVAAVALMIAVGTFAVSFQQTKVTGGEQTLQLHITRYHG